MTRDVFDAFSDAVKHSDDVMECHRVKGGFVYVKARAAGHGDPPAISFRSDSAAAGVRKPALMQ
ncbi:hypothetical protein AJ87_31125 [Rhizobium yanglingense]|nr:hypothetical protein AJ87_31125 [Rhizobium yanglingense]